MSAIADARALVTAATKATSPDDLLSIWEMLNAFGAIHERPIGDRWGNRGLFTAAGGVFDHKLVELVTNMHDAVVLAAVEARLQKDDNAVQSYERVFDSPETAVSEVFRGRDRSELARLARVELHSAGEDARRDRTVVFRDAGIGMRPLDFPDALYRLGSSRKDGVLWQMGAFGRGGLTVMPNCYGWVVVSRKQPELLRDGESDVVTVSASRWVPVGNRQTNTAVYQVTSPWEHDTDEALPFSVPAEACDFEPGTHLAVVGFQAEGIWVSRLGDERSLDTLFDTRLFEPPLPITLTTPALESRDRATILRGLGRRLTDNPRADRQEGTEELPFNHDGTTYRLPIRYFLFAAGDTGSRRRFVARDHALLLNSNGQVHAHWSPAEFRQKTRLPKLADRILGVVDTDALPLPVRTALFTADRTELLRNPDTVRLEEELVAFLNDWEDLWRANNDLIRDAIRRSNADRSTAAVAGKISRALRISSATPARSQPDESKVRRPRPAAALELLDDPTELVLAAATSAIRGRTTGIHVALNARDDFVPQRANLRIECAHPQIDVDADVSVGRLRNGRLRIAMAVPPDADVCTTDLVVHLDDWASHAGGLKSGLVARTELTVTDSAAKPSPSRDEGETTATSAETTARIALLWTSHENEPGWASTTVGDVDVIDATSLAETDSQYAELAGRTFDVPVIRLNEEFGPLKAYSALRARDMGDEGVARAKDRYAVGVGVQLMLLERLRRDFEESTPGVANSTDWLAKARIAAARGVLAVMPDYDQLAAELGLEDL